MVITGMKRLKENSKRNRRKRLIKPDSMRRLDTIGERSLRIANQSRPSPYNYIFFVKDVHLFFTEQMDPYEFRFLGKLVDTFKSEK